MQRICSSLDEHSQFCRPAFKMGRAGILETFVWSQTSVSTGLMISTHTVPFSDFHLHSSLNCPTQILFCGSSYPFPPTRVQTSTEIHTLPFSDHILLKFTLGVLPEMSCKNRFKKPSVEWEKTVKMSKNAMKQCSKFWCFCTGMWKAIRTCRHFSVFLCACIILEYIWGTACLETNSYQNIFLHGKHNMGKGLVFV